ncbi:hypothetical protein KPL74_09420 [Bacillus sp. NP157]|nr:hypothetical protein KPL74_09420 [Bacillus sp. NP157]
MWFVIAIVYCFMNLVDFTGGNDRHVVVMSQPEAVMASGSSTDIILHNVRRPDRGDARCWLQARYRQRGTTVKVIFDGCPASWCTALCATTPLASS